MNRDEKKNKKNVFVLFLGISINLFYCDFCIGIIEGKGQIEEEFSEKFIYIPEKNLLEKCGRMEKEKEIQFTQQEEVDYLIRGWEREEKNVKKEADYYLTIEETAFLEEHLWGVVMGAWEFSERVIALKENVNHREWEVNFSEKGIEEMELNRVMIWYYKEDLWCSTPAPRRFFSNQADIYLYSVYGGLVKIRFPVYQVEQMDTGTIFLDNVYSETGYDEVELDWMKGFYHVYYSMMEAEGAGRMTGYYPANDIYIDPEDTDVIYVDFCGLWKMVRH